MRHICSIALFAVVGIGMSAATVSAQMFPRSRSYRGYDSYDGGALAAAAALGSANSTARTTAQSYQAWRSSATQMPSVQSNIQSAMNAGAQQRSQNIYNQQQSGRDWWFQVQQQQMQQQARTPQYQYAAPSAGFEAAVSAPKVDTDIIQWPTLFQSPAFAAQRAQIEAPYRRSAKGLSSPTADDYQGMIKAADQMKLILKGMTASISAQTYLNGVAYLDKLADEARSRLDEAEPKK